MNIKLHKNVLFDFSVVLIDIMLIILSVFLSQHTASLISQSIMINHLMVPLYLCVILFMFYTYEFYTKIVRNKYEILLSTVITVVAADAFCIIFEFLFVHKSANTSPLFFIVLPFISFVFLGAWKICLLFIVKKIEGVTKLLVIESKDADNSLARKVKYSYLDLYQAWYIQIDVNSHEEVMDLITNTFNEYQSIFISPNIPDELRDVFISEAITLKKEIYILPDLYNISVMKNETVQFDDTPALRIKPFGLTKFQSIVKRVIDLIISSVAIIITSPIMLIAAIAIKLDSPGNIFYKQERVTINKKVFNVLKFRTMKNDAEKSTGPTLATESDPRITRVGRVLRSTRLDELPQFFNILNGSMSIVGPRPERPVFVNDYMSEISNYDKRFFVKAGLTGLAQVYSRYNTNVKDKTLYDLLYIKDFSVWLDIKLILLTVKIMFVRESSDGVKDKPDYQLKV